MGKKNPRSIFVMFQDHRAHETSHYLSVVRLGVQGGCLYKPVCTCMRVWAPERMKGIPARQRRHAKRHEGEEVDNPAACMCIQQT